jgi:hypothetical protein
MKYWVCVGIVALATIGGAQQEPKDGLTRKAPKKVAATSAPVTQAEAKTAFTKAERVLRAALNLPAKGSSPLTAGPRPVTRAQVVGEFNRLYKMVLPSAKLTPRPVKFDQARLRMTGASRADLVKLVRLGAIAPIGPVAAGRKDSLTVAEFGDALGYFLVRMAEITHMPSRKWTPALQDE